MSGSWAYGSRHGKPTHLESLHALRIAELGVVGDSRTARAFQLGEGQPGRELVQGFLVPASMISPVPSSLSVSSSCE